MFTLSEKIKVLNTPSLVKVYNSSNVEVTATASAATYSKLVVEGFGNFDISKIVDIKLEKAIAPAVDSKDFGLIDNIGGVQIGEALEVIVSISTSRYQAEILAQNGIGNGRTVKFSTLPLTAADDDSLVDAIVAGWEKFLELFAIGTPFINVTDGAASTDVKIEAAGGYESITIEKVEVKRVAQGLATQSPVKLDVAVTNTVGTEGKGQGKFLEESVSIANSLNNDVYGVDNADTRVDIRGNYTAVSFSVTAEYDEKLSIVAADAPVGTAIHKFVLYINEATSMAAESAIDKLAEIALLVVANVTAKTANALLNDPLTLAEEKSEVLFINDGSTVATAAAFLSNDTTGQA